MALLSRDGFRDYDSPARRAQGPAAANVAGPFSLGKAFGTLEQEKERVCARRFGL
jgi:hypothetical protein